MRVRRREQVCLSCRRAGTGTGFLALCFKEVSNQQGEPSLWERLAVLLIPRKKKRVYCYLTIERGPGDDDACFSACLCVTQHSDIHWKNGLVCVGRCIHDAPTCVRK